MKVERAKSNDISEIIEVANRIFKGEDQNYFQTYHPALYKDGVNTANDHFVIKEDGKIKGMVGWFPSVMNVMGEKLEVCGIGTVCVEKDCRCKGYMRIIMEEILKELKEKNIPIGILGGRRQRYEYYGFTPSAICTNFYFNNDNAKHVFGKEDTTTYTFTIPNGSESELLEKAFQLYLRRPAYIERTAEGFYDSLRNCRSTPLFIFKNGEFDGYACISGTKGEINEFEISDNSDSCRMLKDYIRNFELGGVSVKQIFHFEREKLHALAKICEGTSVSGADSYLIQDYAKVITALGKLKSSYLSIPDGNVTIEIEGVQKIKVSSENGKIYAEETNEEPQLKISPIEATSAFFGLGAFNLNICEKLPAFANAVFPLPLFFSIPDMI